MAVAKIKTSLAESIRWDNCREERARPENPGDEQCPDGISCLGNPIGDGRPAAAHRDQFFEIGFKTDGHEAQGKKPISIRLGRTADGFDGFESRRRLNKN